MHQALWSVVLASLLLDMSLTSDSEPGGLKATRSRLKYEAPKSDFKSAAIKKKRTEEGATARRQKKKGQPSSKDKFSLSVQDMLAEGWDGRQLEFKSDAGTGTTPDYCPRYNCVPDPKMNWNSSQGKEGKVDGFYHSVCDATYFIGAKKKTWRGAAADCCKRNMRLITITSAEEAICMTNFINVHSSQPSEQGKVPERMWVAASDRGEEGAFKWCYPERLDNFQFPPFMPFDADEPSNTDDIENCLDVSRNGNNFVYSDAYCNLEQLYVCESTHPKRDAVIVNAMQATPLNTVKDCPLYFCEQNPKNKNDESAKKGADMVASSLLKYSCGRKFYIEVYDAKSWKNAAADCCSKGMRLLTIENSYKRECITELLKALDLVSQPQSGKHVTDWWWLAASDKLKEGTFRWCFAQKSKKIKSTPPIPFAKGSPDSLTGNEDCLGMHLQSDTAFLDDKHCDRLAPYICESLSALTKNEHESGNTTDLCPRYNCDRDNPEDRLQFDMNKIRLYLGTTMETCNFEFFFANETRTWRDAASECCRRNMGLLKVSNDKKFSCLKEAFVKGNLPPNRWWIGSSDKAQEGKFRWCFPNSADLHESTLPLPFAKGEPGENQEAEDCLEIINRNDVLALNDRACEASAHFICESTFYKSAASESCDAGKCKTKEEHEVEAISVMSWLLKTGSVSTREMQQVQGSQNIFFTACYRFYALIKPKKFTQSKGASECCKYGLKVASLDSPLELQCVKQFLATEPGTYWTSGTGLEGEFAWCPSGKDIDGELWIPSDKPKSKKCVSLVIGDAIGLENSSCDMPQHVLCESNEY